MYSQEKIDELYSGASIHEAMEFWTLPKHKKHMLEEMCSSGKYYGQLKKDGNWYEYNKGTQGKSFLFSRGTSTKTGLPTESIEKVPHIEEAMKMLPNDTVILGEIYFPGKDSNAVRSVMGCLTTKALSRQAEGGNISFYMFDIIKLDGEDLRGKGAEERSLILEETVAKYKILNEFLELAESVEDDLYNFAAKALADGEEGIILKLKTQPYIDGKRPAWSSIKVKKQDDVDAICVGFENATMVYAGDNIENWELWFDSETKALCKGAYFAEEMGRYVPVTKPFYQGVKTSIKLGAYDKDGKLKLIGTVSSGLTDELRRKITDSPQNYLGRVVSCSCMEVTKDSLRHPTYTTFRKDKTAKSCTFEAIFG